MPTYKGVEVWLADAEHRKFNHRELTISLVDDRTVTVKTEMARNEFYTVHCRSLVSVFCDVFIIATARSRKLAARFHLDKSPAMSDNASGSSTNHTEGKFRDHGLRTPKRQLSYGNLGSVEVEIRRIGEILNRKPLEEYAANGDEDAAIEFTMIDDFNQPPWLVFHFDISFNESRAVLALTTEHIRRRVLRRAVKNQSQATSKNKPRISSAEEPSNETSHKAGYECLHNSRKHRREYDGDDGSPSVSEDPISTNSDLLHEEYQKEEAEEQRLLRKLQERLQTKKTRNMELRRLLGETS